MISAAGDVERLQEDEFDDYRWMQQGLSQRVEAALARRFGELTSAMPGATLLVSSTVALHPLVRYGEVLRGLRDLKGRIALAFPGEERGGKLHFMNQPDGGNYLAVKLFWRCHGARRDATGEMSVDGDSQRGHPAGRRPAGRRRREGLRPGGPCRRDARVRRHRQDRGRTQAHLRYLHPSQRDAAAGRRRPRRGGHVDIRFLRVGQVPLRQGARPPPAERGACGRLGRLLPRCVRRTPLRHPARSRRAVAALGS